MTEYERLMERLEGKKFSGYRSENDYSTGSKIVFNQSILEEYFKTNSDESWKMERLEKKLSNLKLRERDVYNRSLLGNLMGLSEWYEDQNKGLIIVINKGFLFPENATDKYFRGFGYPRIYQLEDKERLLDMKREDYRSGRKIVLCGLATLGYFPIKELVNLESALIYVALAVTYLAYNFLKENKKFEEGPKPIVPKENSIEKLRELYLFKKSF